VAGSLFTFRQTPVIAGDLAQRGLDPAEIFVGAGLPAEAMRGEVTAPLERIIRLVDAAAEALGDPHYGISLAERVPAGAYGVNEFLARSAPDVDTALRVVAEFAALINPIGSFHYQSGALHYAVVARRDGIGMQLNEYTIAYIVRQLLVIIGRPVLAQVWFAHERKRGREHVERTFACEVAFGAADSGFALAPGIASWAPRTADAPLFAYLQAQARAQLARLAPSDVVSQVMRVIEMRLGQGDVDAPAVAAAMATTVRSLQRRLGEAGTTFREVLAHVRRRRAGELRRGGLKESEIARALGFVNAGSMRRSLA